jgi:hypothetical protein
MTRAIVTAMRCGGTDNPLAFVGTFASLQQLIVPVHEMVARRPSPGFRHDVERLRPLREAVQRDMSGSKMTNARRDLPVYIKDKAALTALTHNGWSGPVWTATLWLPKPLELYRGGVDAQDLVTEYLLDPTEKGFCLDMESRAFALEDLLNSAETPEMRRAILDIPLIFLVYDGIDIKRAAQHFRDINGLGIGINASVLLSHDWGDPYMQVTRDVFGRLGLELEEQMRQVSARSEAIMTVVQARTMVSAVAHGITAVSFGARRIPTDVDGKPVDFGQLTSAATLWLGKVFTELRPEDFKDRSLVLGSAPVIASLGALGVPFYNGDAEAQQDAEAVLRSGIDWSRGEHWAGFAGKVNPDTGRFSVSSGKESGHATYRAMTKAESSGYAQIRHTKKVVRR